jgi:hypothetical protein
VLFITRRRPPVRRRIVNSRLDRAVERELGVAVSPTVRGRRRSKRYRTRVGRPSGGREKVASGQREEKGPRDLLPIFFSVEAFSIFCFSKPCSNQHLNKLERGVLG